jgi:hypothetical protein
MEKPGALCCRAGWKLRLGLGDITADGLQDGVEFVEVDFDEAWTDAVAGYPACGYPASNGSGADVVFVGGDCYGRESALRFVGEHSISLCGLRGVSVKPSRFDVLCLRVGGRLDRAPCA